MICMNLWDILLLTLILAEVLQISTADRPHLHRKGSWYSSTTAGMAGVFCSEDS